MTTSQTPAVKPVETPVVAKIQPIGFKTIGGTLSIGGFVFRADGVTEVSDPVLIKRLRKLKDKIIEVEEDEEE